MPGSRERGLSRFTLPGRTRHLQRVLENQVNNIFWLIGVVVVVLVVLGFLGLR